jgi:hypothetical protein
MLGQHGVSSVKIIDVEEKILKLGLSCSSWDSFLDELYLLGESGEGRAGSGSGCRHSV